MIRCIVAVLTAAVVLAPTAVADTGVGHKAPGGPEATHAAPGRPPAPQGWQHVIDRAHAFYRTLGIPWIS